MNQGITREALAASSRTVVLLDVRTAAEFAEGSVPEAKNVPPERLDDEVVPMGALVVTVCNHGGARSQAAAEVLRARGIDSTYLVGGVKGPKAGH